ncbi:uncharacterized protein LOC133174860 [Saccostrea echinata]|uniref:uncharacterized protein LOC133174860 n=1 Tax=Saccostrea echinata TaxID=191078 RepID=UPI002A82B892|nr:uncharacterized protein LOC133174860 [Saccostrea echinata]
MKFRGRGKSAPIVQLTDVIERGYFQQVRFFIDLGIDIDSPNGNQRTPLMLCSVMEPEEWGTGIARLLIEKGALLDCVDRYGMNAMHLACIYGRVELARILLNALDFDLTEGDKWGNTVLHYALRAGSVPLVRLVVHAHKKYKIQMDRKNRDGLSALEEAHKFSHGRCAAIISAAERIAEEDVELLLPPPTLDLRFSKDTLNTHSASERSVMRPKTAFVTRRGSLSSSSSTSSIYLAQKPIFVREFAGARREKLPNEKDFNQIIRCASLSDFRNNPEYLYNLTVPGAIPPNGCQTGHRQTDRPKSCYVRRPNSVSSEGPGFSWRVEFKKLFVHYEYQCTPSYRDAAKYVPGELPSLDGNISPVPHEDVEDGERGKKGKRCGSGKKETAEKSRKQSQQQQKQRKQSNIQVPQDKGKQSSTSLDGSLGSSSESIGSSGASSKKQQGNTGDTQSNKPTREKSSTESHGRMSRTMHYGKNVPHVAVHDGDGSSGDGRTSKTPPIDQNRLKP